MQKLGFLKILPIVIMSSCVALQAQEPNSADIAGQCGVQQNGGATQTKKNSSSQSNQNTQYDKNGLERQNSNYRRLTTEDYEKYSLKQNNVDAKGRDTTSSSCSQAKKK